jgi:hypothetical protein
VGVKYGKNAILYAPTAHLSTQKASKKILRENLTTLTSDRGGLWFICTVAK